MKYQIWVTTIKRKTPVLIQVLEEMKVGTNIMLRIQGEKGPEWVNKNSFETVKTPEEKDAEEQSSGHAKEEHRKAKSAAIAALCAELTGTISKQTIHDKGYTYGEIGDAERDGSIHYAWQTKRWEPGPYPLAAAGKGGKPNSTAGE